MTREEYISEILKTYSPLKCLSSKNDGKVMVLIHRTLGKKIVLRSYKTTVSAYNELCNIKCDNLPIIYDTKNLSDGQIVFEEYIDGVNISEIMETGHYKYLGAKRVLKGVCSALQVLHERNIIHRDIKPENVMITNKGRVVLLDFNASRKEKAVEKDTVIMGTVGYASPEQMGLAQSGKGADIYALGVLLNVMLTGEHPSVLLAKGKAGRIVRKCTNINPSDRYKTIAHFVKEL